MNFKKNRKTWAVPGLLALAPLALSTPLHAADAPTTYLWDSGGQLSVGQPTGWGNGVAKLSRAITYNGDDVLQMTTRNFNEGVLFELNPPVDLSAYQKEGFIRIRLRFRDGAATGGALGGFPGGEGGFGSTPNFGAPAVGGLQKILPPLINFQQRPRPSSPMGGSSGPPGGFQGSPPGGFQGSPPGGLQGRTPGGFPGGPPGGFPGGFPGGEGGPGALLPLGPPPQETKVRRLLISFVLEHGVMSGALDIPTDLEKVKPDDEGWRLFLIPVKDLHATPKAAGEAQRLIITSDKEDTLFLAQAALVVETGQMQVSIRRPSDQRGAQVAELNLKPGLVTLVADVEAGTADPVIEWNFDADNVNPELSPPAAAPAGGEGFPAGPEGFPAQPGRTPGSSTPGSGLSSPGTSSSRMGSPRGTGRTGGPGFGGPDAGGEGALTDIPEGPHVHARGLVAKFEYPNEEQDYRVEVTVTDRAGKKAPAKSSLLIHIRG